MNYYATSATKENVVAIDATEAASLETMKAFSALGYADLVRFIVAESDFIAYSNGVNLTARSFGYYA